MQQPLLTILVPTYNRADCLEELLRVLEVELAGLEGKISVVLGDNASEDRTAQLTAAFAQRWVDTLVLRHASNVGPDENFCRCIEKSESTYFWLVGDDDLPRAGFLPALVKLLEENDPDLVYLQSRWSKTLQGHGPDDPVASLHAVLADRLAFARRLHVWSTFISGCVVRRAFARDEQLRRFAGTNLVQLGWVFAALRDGERFIHVETPVILATLANSGGYSVLRIFGRNFPRITREVFCGRPDLEEVGAAIRARNSLIFLPGLVWSLKHAKSELGRFDKKESVSAAMEDQVGGTFAYWCFMRPIGFLPFIPAAAVRFAAWVAGRLVRVFDRIREVGGGTARRL